MEHPLRMRSVSALANPISGRVIWAPFKSIWYTTMLVTALLLGPTVASWPAISMSAVLTSLTLCLGHSVGMHRLLIHRSFECPRWLEYVFVTLGTLIGMAGPTKIIYMHDIRDWSQRHENCHDFLRHGRRWWVDWFWNLHCELRLTHPPDFRVERRVSESRYYRLLDRFWLMPQLLLAIALWVVGSWAFVVWGTCVRVAISLTGHWWVGYLAHNGRNRDWHISGAAVQGYNVDGLGLITFGEAWHNNHHAFPDSARFGLKPGQSDAGWWLLTILEGLGFVWDLKLPKDLPHRSELQKVSEPDLSAIAPRSESQEPLTLA